MNHSPYILLISATGTDTRIFHEFETRGEMAQAFTTFYEDLIHQMFANKEELEYTTDDLFEFLDTRFEEVCCLELVDGAYVPYSADWIKDVIFLELRKRIQESGDEEMMEF